MRLCALLFGSLLLPCIAGADSYAFTRITVNGQSSEAKLYRKGDSFRSEHTNGNMPAVTLFNQQNHVSIIVDPVRREYMPFDSNLSWIASLATWLQRPLTPANWGVTVHHRFELMDTGEQRIAFGHVVKHLRLTEETIAPPGACLSSSKTERDGWYFVDRPKPSQQAYLAAFGGSFRLTRLCSDTIVDDEPRPVLGYAVQENITAFGQLQQTREVLEFSEAALDPKLFQVPTGYRRVDKMPSFPSQRWEDRVRQDWMMLSAAVQSWFD